MAPKDIQAGIGLCSICRYAKTVTSNKGSTFWRCLRSEEDKTFPKYPPLPVLRCRGFEERG